MPVYNAAPFLPSCLESIISQTFQAWELLAVDDFSTDESLAILRRFARKDNRINVFQNQEKGIIHALRTALAHSSGRFITRMDADDIMHPDKLKALQDLLLKNGTGSVAIGLVQYFSEQALGNGYRRYEGWLNTLTLKGHNYQDIYRECVIPSPSWMVYRTDFYKCGAFDSSVYPEDYDLCFRFYKNDMQVVHCPEVLHLWRDHSSRASRNDPHYSDVSYFDLKVPYFLELDYKPERSLMLWGAGRKGKAIAKRLLKRKIPFKWVCNNPKKWHTTIYDHPLFPSELIWQTPAKQIIIAVSNPEEQKIIRKQCAENDCKIGQDYYFFC